MSDAPVGGEHRGTRAVSQLIERAPATGSLALWMQHRDVDKLAVAAPIANDGRTVFYTPAFAQLDLLAQVGWVAHQILHVAFRHVTRRESLRGVLGDVDDTLFTVCADVLVNSTLSHLDWMTLPRGALSLDQFVARVLHEDLSLDAALARYDVERLYRAVDDRRAAGAGTSHGGGEQDNARRSGQRATTKSGTSNAESANTRQASEGVAVRADGPRSAAARTLHNAESNDLLPAQENEQPEDAAQAQRSWSQRLLRGHASDGEFSLLRVLSADVPRSRVPWQQVLRTRVARRLIRAPEVSWSRPSRSWLANQGRSANGRRLPFEPGRVSARLAPSLVVVLDVSGSIDDALLAQLSTHLRALCRQSGAVSTVIGGDDRVRFVEQLKGAELDLTAFKFDGGGGTDFEPLLAEAAQHRPDYAVVLTDLDGPAGPTPAFPVLWAVTAEHAEAEVPFGRLLVVD